MRPGLVVLAFVLFVAPSSAQTRQLTLDDIYDPARRIDFTGAGPSGFSWISDTHYVWPRPADAGVEWVKVDAATGAAEPLFDAQRMRTAFAAVPGLRATDVERLPGSRSLEMNATYTAALVSLADDLYYYPFGGERAFRLTFDPYLEEEFSFSPDGRQAAFVRRNDLYVVSLGEQREERQLTTSGTAQILNGKLDWVYQEEIYGRGSFRAYWWSPDSTRLAFLQIDDRPVPEFTVVDHIPSHLVVEEWEYPKAGDPNPLVRLGVVRAVGGDIAWVDLSKYSAIDFLIVNVSWSPDSARVVFQVQDREQTWLDLNTAGGDEAAPHTLFRETTKAWVDPIGPPVWLKDGTFLWLSDRSGWRHVYRAGPGTPPRQITSGNWDIRTFHGVDEAEGWMYFSASERSPVGVDVYRARLEGGEMRRLVDRGGTHRAAFSPGMSLFLDTWSDLYTPPQVRVHRSDGAEVRVVHRSEIPELAQFRLSKPELLQVPTRDGFLMEAMLIRPVDFDPARKYPVMQFTYGGPGASSVRNAWGGTTGMYYQLLAQNGIAVWICDNRLASGKGAQSQWPSYKNFGELELRDVEDGLTFLKKHPWVDAARIGIDGWSFGGFMVTYAMTHSTSFTMGIAGGSVTDWRLYDSIYTERFMLMPQHNPEGYDRSSVLAAAKNLHGLPLLIHGVMDENVHAQNTLKLTYELQKAGKPFRLMLYERSRHGVNDPALVKHMRQMMFDFTLERLTPVR